MRQLVWEHAMAIYDGYAAVYDASGQLSFSLRMIGYLEELLEHFAPPGKRIELPVALARWRCLARRGASSQGSRLGAWPGRGPSQGQAVGVDVAWSQQDMRGALPEPCDVATCLYDGSAPCSSDDLAAVFGRWPGADARRVVLL